MGRIARRNVSVKTMLLATTKMAVARAKMDSTAPCVKTVRPTTTLIQVKKN